MKKVLICLATIVLTLNFFVHDVYAGVASNSEKNFSFSAGLKAPPPQSASAAEEVKVDIYPNPVVDNAVIKINTGGRRISSLVISDAIGNRITTLSFNPQDGTIVRYHNFSGLRPGIYFCSVYVNSDIMDTAKIIKR